MTADNASAPTPAEVHKGLEGVVVAETRIGEVDGKLCQLIYCGYNIDELVGRASYEEVGYLLLYGALPSRPQLWDWIHELESHRALDPPVLAALRMLPKTANPMALLRTAISILGLYDAEAGEETVDGVGEKAMRTLAKTTTIVAAVGRRRKGAEPISPKPGLSHAANFLYMLHGSEPTEQEAAALDIYFILLAEHGLNASTFSARTVIATLSDYYSALTAAVVALKGSLHGAANRKAMEMLIEIGAPERVESYVQKTLADHKRLMGFGHRVYKGEDPRAKHLKGIAKALGDTRQDLRWFTISEELQRAVMQAKKLYINVDFYSASLLYYLGIPTELFTTMFACARVPGWSAHVMEQLADNRLIRPGALYVGPRDLKFVPIEKR